jgi:hypothetical protein
MKMSQSDKTSPAGSFPWKEILVFLGVLITAYFGYLGIRSQIEIPIHATQTAEARLTEIASMSSMTPSPTLSPLDIEKTAIASETQSAEQRGTVIAQWTQEAGATATQQYLYVLQTVQADATAKALFAQVATEQVYNSEATAQSIISTQQAATAIVNNQNAEQILDFADKLPNLPVSFSDTFENNNNGWSPKSGNGYSVSMKGDVLKVNFSDSALLPFIWTCDNCGTFNNFSYQIDIKTPKDTQRVVAGILFGSPTKIDQQPFQESYALSIYSSGAVLLQRISLTKIDTVELWDHRPDLITPDGEFHTLQVIAIDKYAAVYVDGKLIGDVLKLDYSTAGYIGVVSQSTGVDVVFDNLKVVLMP